MRVYRTVGRILHAPATVVATTRPAGVAIWACSVIPKTRYFIVLTVEAYVREMDILLLLINYRSRPN